MKQLTVLDCSDCYLKEIPLLEHLIELDCSGTARLEVIPIFKQLIKLRCCYCESLTEIPLLPQLK
jgi:hypothetical protein